MCHAQSRVRVTGQWKQQAQVQDKAEYVTCVYDERIQVLNFPRTPTTHYFPFL